MNPTPPNRLQALWLRMSFVDIAALVVIVAYAALWVSRSFFPRTPQGGFLLFLAVLAFGYVMVRGFRWARKHLLWSLRNRLVIAYLFIAVVPVLLLLTMAGLGAYLLYWQLGAYFLYTDMQERLRRVFPGAGADGPTLSLQTAPGRPAP